MVQYWSNIGSMVQYWSNIGVNALISCHIWRSSLNACAFGQDVHRQVMTDRTIHVTETDLQSWQRRGTSRTDATCCMQHCWVMLQHAEQGWPNERNMLHPFSQGFRRIWTARYSTLFMFIFPGASPLHAQVSSADFLHDCIWSQIGLQSGIKVLKRLHKLNVIVVGTLPFPSTLDTRRKNPPLNSRHLLCGRVRRDSGSMRVFTTFFDGHMIISPPVAIICVPYCRLDCKPLNRGSEPALLSPTPTPSGSNGSRTWESTGNRAGGGTHPSIVLTIVSLVPAQVCAHLDCTCFAPPL